MDDAICPGSNQPLTPSRPHALVSRKRPRPFPFTPTSTAPPPLPDHPLLHPGGLRPTRCVHSVPHNSAITVGEVGSWHACDCAESVELPFTLP